MAEYIPLLNTPRQSLISILADQEIHLRVWWQPSDESWYASIEHPVGTPVVLGRRVLLDVPIIGTAPSVFNGDLVCRGLTDAAGEPGPEAWGNSHALVYEE